MLTQSDAGDPLLTPKQARGILGWPPVSSFTRWARQGLIKTAEYTPGGHRRFRQSAVTQFKASLSAVTRFKAPAAITAAAT